MTPASSTTAGGTDFIQQFIFPGGAAAGPERFEAEPAKASLEVVGQMAPARDYAETLRRWRRAFWRRRCLRCVPRVSTRPSSASGACTCATARAGFDERRTDVVQFHLRKLA